MATGDTKPRQRLGSSNLEETTIVRPMGESTPLGQFNALLNNSTITWPAKHQLVRRLGAGGQGVVYLADRLGADGWEIPVAIKFFSPDPYPSMDAYVEDMGRIAQVLARVAVIQQDHLLDVHNFMEMDRIRVMSMEWIDGFDLDYLLAPATLDQIQQQVTGSRRAYLNDVVITSGARKSRIKSGVAIAIIQECLAALAALHRDGIVHGDLKPANIMLKKTGNAKIIDLGSACSVDHVRGHRPFTPQYAAPEVLKGDGCTPFSDLASLGYVLLEMLAGMPMFAGITDYHELLEAKYKLVDCLHEMLPNEVMASESLMQVIRTLVAPEPHHRHPGDEAADQLKIGAASFQQELVNGDLASEYETEIRLWLKDLG
jgi:serine/threonine protein kinase